MYAVRRFIAVYHLNALVASIHPVRDDESLDAINRVPTEVQELFL
jgi:hypothetical protein